MQLFPSLTPGEEFALWCSMAVLVFTAALIHYFGFSMTHLEMAFNSLCCIGGCLAVMKTFGWEYG